MSTIPSDELVFLLTVVLVAATYVLIINDLRDRKYKLEEVKDKKNKELREANTKDSKEKEQEIERIQNAINKIPFIIKWSLWEIVIFFIIIFLIVIVRLLETLGMKLLPVDPLLIPLALFLISQVIHFCVFFKSYSEDLK